MLKALQSQLLAWFKPRRGSLVVGLELQTDGMALVVQDWSGGKATLRRLDYLPYEKSVAPEQLLKNWVTEYRLNNLPCAVVLGAETYQILLVEPPEVPSEELRGAIRWRLKDLLTIPVEQAALEVFELPADGTRSNKKMVYVVACENQKIRNVVNMVNDAGLTLECIDIGELALRNLAQKLVTADQAERGVAIARVRHGAGSIYIYRHGNLYLGRTFSLSYNGGLLDALPEEALALELQRSLDYYERQMGQVPPALIYIGGEQVSEDKIGPVLKASLTPRVLWLNPADAISIAEADPDNGLVQHCIAALGGALRLERAA